MPSSCSESSLFGRRNREYLEGFPLDALKMVGTLHVAGKLYGLVQDKDRRVHRVTTGDHMGQREGRIIDITPAKISLVELAGEPGETVPGSRIDQPAALTLN
jgi:type IV pilus assembly protein PilP